MKRNNLERKTAKSHPRRRENKRELLKASNETQKPQKKDRKKNKKNMTNKQIAVGRSQGEVGIFDGTPRPGGGGMEDLRPQLNHPPLG